MVNQETNMTEQTISTQAHPKKFIDVLGKRMAYVEMGDPNGRPLVFVR